MNASFVLALILVVSLLGCLQSEQNLLENPSFEEGELPGSGWKHQNTGRDSRYEEYFSFSEHIIQQSPLVISYTTNVIQDLDGSMRR
ncbi:MAG: hypothetical protein HXS46_18290 [Theionarchaea archaeon]|nr:MAG: hypothetical protein AYK18_08810 [Theionarchaea archaeon DG-70]MBU7012636.1 hypothetical protein [Theionarchaea archaeon]